MFWRTIIFHLQYVYTGVDRQTRYYDAVTTKHWDYTDDQGRVSKQNASGTRRGKK